MAMHTLKQGSVQLIIQSFDRDSGNDDYIDVAVINIDGLDLRATQLTTNRNYIGVFGFSRYGLSFQARCAEDYYSSDCSVYCTPRDNSLGHYYCKQDGSIECLPGYKNPLTSCTQCSTSSGCCESSILVMPEHSASFHLCLRLKGDMLCDIPNIYQSS